MSTSKGRPGVSVKGAKGSRGPKGNRGLVGERGPKGERGDASMGSV